MEKKNQLIADNKLPPHPKGRTADKPVQLKVKALGLISGCIDYPTQFAGFYTLGANNTYDIPFLNQTIASKLLDQYSRAGGCKDHYLECRRLMKDDPWGDKGIVAACLKKANEGVCSIMHDQQPTTEFEYMTLQGRNRFDITHNNTDGYPWIFWKGYLMNQGIQRELGVRVNYTSTSPAVSKAFKDSYDRFGAGYLEDISYLLEKGVKVALVYGDRDFACNWFGGELASLAVKYNKAKEFAAAGYTNIIGGDGKVGGEVRQYGHFSFSRVFQAGHASKPTKSPYYLAVLELTPTVPAYAPEISFRIFERVLNGMDIATGKEKVTDGYSTKGPAKSLTKNKNEGFGEAPKCYLPDAEG